MSSAHPQEARKIIPDTSTGRAMGQRRSSAYHPAMGNADRSVRLKVERPLFENRVQELLAQAHSLQAYAAGPEPEASRTFRQQFLAWMAEVERALAWGVEGVDVAVGLQTPRLLSIIQDRVPDLQLYRALEAEILLKVSVLSSLVDGASPEGQAHEEGGTPTNRPPRAFLSHAKEDKDRFVVDFARRLRSSGIDAWLDYWELQPGDSLVDRIFEEGIGSADAFIVVLSKNSVDKKWVREELNAAVVRRLSEGTRLIPVLIDDVEVPQALRSTFWVKVALDSGYDNELDQIIRAIYGHTEKPALGPPPSWVHPAVQVPGLGATDSVVLSLAAEQAIASGHRLLDSPRLVDACAKADIGTDACLESLSALGHAHLLELGEPTSHTNLEITNQGLATFLEATRGDLGPLRKQIVAALINRPDKDTPVDASDLVEATGEPALVVELLLDQLRDRGLITLAKYIGGRMSVHDTSPLLRRELD